MKEPVRIRENISVPIEEILGRLPSAEDLTQFRREVRIKGERIRHDTRFRNNPLSIGESGPRATFRASGISGALNLFGTNIQVSPKFVVSPDHLRSWQQSVITMLDSTRKKVFTYSRVRDLALRRATFIDHVALAYSDAIQSALREEAIHVYERREERAPFLRGRFAVERQMRSILDRPHRIECDVDYRETNNHFNHLLHWAADRFSSLVLDSQVRRQVDRVKQELPAVSGPPRVPMHLPLRAPAQYRHFDEPLDIASILARGYAHGDQRGAFAGYGFVLNMEKLFEDFVEASLRRSQSDLSLELRPQDVRLYAKSIGKVRSYYTRPDNALYKSGLPALLVDAKYKTLGEGDVELVLKKPNNADVYQLFASMVAHGCTRGLLVYPQILSDEDLGDGKVRWWGVSTEAFKALIGAVALPISDLRSKSALGNVDGHLRAIVNAALGQALPV